MSRACTPILVGVASSVSEILLLAKTAKFPFPTMDYSPWSSRNLIDRNRLKEIMQIFSNDYYISPLTSSLSGSSSVTTSTVPVAAVQDNMILNKSINECNNGTINR